MFAKTKNKLSQVIVMVISLSAFGAFASEENTPTENTPEPEISLIELILIKTSICHNYPKCDYIIPNPFVEEKDETNQQKKDESKKQK